MEDFLKMDVFFVVATAATVLIGLLVAVLLAYAIKFLRTVNRISEDVEEETEALREDIADVRKKVRSFSFLKVFSMFTKAGKRAASRSRKKKTD